MQEIKNTNTEDKEFFFSQHLCIFYVSSCCWNAFCCKNLLVVLFSFNLHTFKNYFMWAEYVFIG